MAPITRSLTALGPDTLVKALRTDRTHHGVVYALGRNECPQPFNDKECADGGLYACRLKDLLRWISLYPDIDTVAVVEVPEDAQRCEFATKTKASALVLTRFLPLLEAMELAVQHGADIHADNDYALRVASENGHVSVVQFLVEVGHADVHADDDGALNVASLYGHLAIVQFLVEHGANVHACDDAALHVASQNGHLAVVQFLVTQGANVHALDENALSVASRNGHLPVVQFLVEVGHADVHAYDDEALHVASQNGHLAVVQFLVAHGADVHASNDYALRWASEYGHLTVVEFLRTLRRSRRR